MCGIACFIDYQNGYNVHDLNTITDTVTHRGPDGRGVGLFTRKDFSETSQDDYFLGFGHRRLSILDLSDAGAQPMFSEDRNVVIIYNGEVYNYIELQSELEKAGYKFNSDCDTEVVLNAYRHWGKNCLSKFNGMWSLVILDKNKRQLFVARDRIGIKPLYYCINHNFLILTSEIKQILALPGFNPRPNEKVCVSYLASGYETPPETFFEDIFAFPPGHFAEIDLDKPAIKPEQFWFPENIELAPRQISELIAEIQDTFLNAVKMRLRSDVPVGGCLSGGLDSSSIFVEMKNLASSQTFDAFSACFNEPDIDERHFMSSVIDRTGSRHHQVFPDEDQLVSDFDEFLNQHDEPVGSISMYAQYKVMEAARKENVPVLLDGQGGDELFSGYWPAYLLALNYHRQTGDYLFVLKNLLGAMLPGGNFDLLSIVYWHYREYRRRASHRLPFEIKKDLIDKYGFPTWHLDAQKLSPAEYRRAEILKIHLPRLLKWEDRNSMAFSIESRVPFLDFRLMELILSVPPEQNLRNGWNKYLFRKAMDKKLPDDICWRKDKKGFETPQEKWMKEGSFHQLLIKWCHDTDHPVASYIDTDFKQIQEAVDSLDFNSTTMFRLFCLNHWLEKILN